MPKRKLAEFVMKTSKYCNLRCAYCYEYRELANQQRMSLDNLVQIFENIAHHAIANQYEAVRFVWHGGEPFMIPLAYYDSIGQLQRDIFGDRVAIWNVVQTNLTVLTDRHLLFLKLRKFFHGVGISFDVHGDQRVDTQGQLRTEQVLRNLQKLIDYQIPFGAIAVLARNTLPHVRQIYRFYDQLSISCRFLPFYLSAFDGQIGDHAVAYAELVAALKSIFDEWVASEQATRVEPIDEYVGYAVDHVAGRRGCYYRRESDEFVFVVGLDGGVWGQAEAYQSAFQYGNLAHGSFDEILTSKGRRLSIEQAESRLDRHPYFGACPGSFVADSSPQQQKQLEESGCSVKEIIDHILGTFERTGLSHLISKHATPRDEDNSIVSDIARS